MDSDVRDVSAPLEFQLFDRKKSNIFLGSARLPPLTNENFISNQRRILPLEPRDEFGQVTGELEVLTCLVEDRHQLSLHDFNLLEAIKDGIFHRKMVSNTANEG